MKKYFMVPEKLYLKLTQGYTEDDLRGMTGIDTAPAEASRIDATHHRMLTPGSNLPLITTRQSPVTAPSLKRPWEDLSAHQVKRFRTEPPETFVDEPRKGIKRGITDSEYIQPPLKRLKSPGEWLQSEEGVPPSVSSRQPDSVLINSPPPKKIRLYETYPGNNPAVPQLLPEWMNSLESSLESMERPPSASSSWLTR